MHKPLRSLAQATSLALAGLLLLPLAHAEKPEWAGHGKPDKEHERRHTERRDKEHDARQYERRERHELEQRRAMVELRFSDGDRRFIRDYYGAQMTLPLFCGVHNPRFTRPFCAVPRTSVFRTASG